MEKKLGLYLRLVEQKDSELLFQWRNDQTVRTNSFQMEEIPRDVHENWLHTTLADSNQYFFILMKADIPLGQVRVQKKANIGMVNYSIAESYRAQGFGKKILILLENYLITSNNSMPLKAYVKRDNIASQKIFNDLGYSLISQSDFFYYQKALLEYKPVENN